MSLRWNAAVVDCHDVRSQSRWWAEVLGWQIACEDQDGLVTVLPPHLAGAPREVPPAERWPGLLFQTVPEGRQLENRLYITLAPPHDGDQQAEIRRLEGLGATLISVGEGDVDWVIMEDPEATGSACSAHATRASPAATSYLGREASSERGHAASPPRARRLCRPRLRGLALERAASRRVPPWRGFKGPAACRPVIRYARRGSAVPWTRTMAVASDT